MTPRLGIAGRLAAPFLRSKLTPLLIVTSALLGVYAVIALPREEEPQIIVPMIDIFVDFAGAGPTEVEQRVTRPIERALWEVPGVEYLYSTSSPGRAMIIARFLVGQDEQRALVRVNEKLGYVRAALPPGAAAPLVQVRSIDNVPVMALTLWGERYDDIRLRELGGQLRDALTEVPDVSEVTIIGGRKRQVTVQLDPAALEARGLDPLGVSQALARANIRQAAGQVVAPGKAIALEAGSWPDRWPPCAISSSACMAARPCASPTWPRSRTPAAIPRTTWPTIRRAQRSHPAVTLSIAKRQGTNAIELTRRIEEKVASVRGYTLPADLEVTITRNYGETAAHKSNELLWHMFLAIVSVSILIWITLGRRESLVVMIAIPVTLALTLLVFYLYGYTLNRITLFALIFSIGILVDDAIVVVENIVRHAREDKGVRPIDEVAVQAVDEVGNPTILATLTVVAAILPMAFVGGLMGPYMRPIPVGATAAMIFSLAVAFIVTPWAAVRLLKTARRARRDARGPVHADLPPRHGAADHRAARALGVSRRRSSCCCVAAMALVPLGLVTVKMLPFDNKSELQLVVRMPDNTPLESTARVTSALAGEAMRDPARRQRAELRRHRVALHVQRPRASLLPAPGGVSGGRPGAARAEGGAPGAEPRHRAAPAHAPRSAGGLARRHHSGRRGPARSAGAADAGGRGLRPGPREAARPGAPGAEDVRVDRGRRGRGLVRRIEPPHVAARGGCREGGARRSRRGGRRVTRPHGGRRHDGRTAARSARARAGAGGAAAAARLPRVARCAAGAAPARLPRRGGWRDHASGADAARAQRLPQEPAAGDLRDGRHRRQGGKPRLRHPADEPVARTVRTPSGEPLPILNTQQPDDSSQYAMKWDGEWHITYEVFRDLGLAFAAVLILIYILVVGWFQSFSTPLTIMLAIPFSLVGILPAHAASGAFFTATSMIGFIAGAGIVVRNSIILVDFIELRVRDGMPLAEAVIDAGAVRFRPMALTAAAVVVGAGVILFDPIFQGLAISLMAGEVASLLLSRMVVPVIYFMVQRRQVVPAPVQGVLLQEES